jgi:hypothetical protein
MKTYEKTYEAINMYGDSSIYSFVSKVLNNNNMNVNITKEKILKNSISRLDLLIPAPIKTVLKEISRITETTMTMHAVRALLRYLQDFNVSETELDLITVKRSEYLEIIEENKELKKKLEKLSKKEEEHSKSECEMEELKKRLRGEERKNKELERESKKLKKKVEKYEKRDPILKLESALQESPEHELLLSEAFSLLNITHANDKSKFVDNHINLNKELSSHPLVVYDFLDERLSDYHIVIENNEENNSSIYDGKIITNSKLNIMLNEVKEKNEKQMELERLKKRMKEYKKPLEKELLAIKQRHPELSKSILEYVAKLNRAETPQQLMNVINELQEWLKQYSIALPEDVIEKTIKNLKTEQLNDNERWRQLLR